MKKIIENREKALAGILSFMPYGLDRLSAIVPGQVPELPTIITGSTSAGKSSLARYLYLMKAVELAIEKGLPYKLILFNLEDSNDQVKDMIRCYLYYKRYGEIIDVLLLNSRKLRHDGTFKLMTPIQLERVKSLEPELEAYLSYVLMFDNKYTNIEIYLEVLKEASKIGKFYYEWDNGGKLELKPVSYIEITKGKEFNKFIRDKGNEQLMISVMVDNANKLMPTEGEKDLYTAINQMNAYACIGIIKTVGFHYLGLHQQNAISTSIDHIKFDYFLPKENNLGDSNFPSRDARQMIGIAQPFKFNQKTVGKYNLLRLKGYFRVINVMKNTYGATGAVIPVLLIPQACTFITLPDEPTDEYLEKIYDKIDKIKEYEES